MTRARICPPCHGECNGGRLCPHRAVKAPGEERAGMQMLAGLFMVLVVVVLFALGMAALVHLIATLAKAAA